ncbi:MAG: C_GCAxxG_C_C family protein [Bacteroides sp.]|nr:C_GCAxxG_C_C family protein [Bacteroides sp.]MBD5294090.1 C_GCAxxG_C_C family protein [Bacteroides sp.]MBD5359267.1 C_GCAxxG_C_C family protein [Bacteroides sp.]MBD5362285.1 C_GCAxxG_C_C family protein [Bacteroides sp.]MBD5371785.1 C_GCAxxG_C_C family protein [Bacteroides sp.]
MVEDKKRQALELRKQGYNCAQCVAMVYDASLEATVAALGTGVAATGNICGAANAMAIIAGREAYVGPMEKQALYGRVARLIEKFKERNCGHVNCCDLRRPGRKPCTELITDAIEILDEEGY